MHNNFKNKISTPLASFSPQIKTFPSDDEEESDIVDTGSQDVFISPRFSLKNPKTKNF